MGPVMIKCPATGHDIPTGLTADRHSFHATPVFFARAWCTLCRKEHEWFAQEAWVCDAPKLGASHPSDTRVQSPAYADS